MRTTRLIGIGASAGGVEALTALVEGLEAGLDAAVLIVLHHGSAGPTVLPEILARRCPLDVRAARDGEALRPGDVLVAPPDRHLGVGNGLVRLSTGPRENHQRPSVDVLFRSLALEAGPGAVGVVLSGMLDDGAAGLEEIVRRGGTAVVQDPDEAAFPSMPRAALHRVPDARVSRCRDVGPLLRSAAAQDGPDGNGVG